jgi:hypothetical protein
MRIWYYEFVHGDLDLRNILVDTESLDTPVLIDFPAVGRHSTAVAVDFVKVEAELIILALGYRTGKDADAQDFVEWVNVIASLSSEEFLIDGEGVLRNVRCIRRCYLRERENDSVSARLAAGYFLALAARISKYLLYPDVVATKKVLVLIWLEKLMARLENFRGSISASDQVRLADGESFE